MSEKSRKDFLHLLPTGRKYQVQQKQNGLRAFMYKYTIQNKAFGRMQLPVVFAPGEVEVVRGMN